MTAEREGLAALLAEHYPSGYVCGTDCDHPLNSPQGWAEHIADALADLLAARDRRVRAEAWEEGHDTCCAVYARHCSYAVNPFAEEADA